jgi:hypothetical protein
MEDILYYLGQYSYAIFVAACFLAVFFYRKLHWIWGVSVIVFFISVSGVEYYYNIYLPKQEETVKQEFKIPFQKDPGINKYEILLEDPEVREI